MRTHVAFTPAEEVAAPVGIVVDVLRATSTITQALGAGYSRVLCCSEVEEARAVATAEGDAVLAGERGTTRIDGFDFGNSPREFLDPAAGTVVLTTTNGTRLLLAAASRCDVVLVGSLLNLRAVVEAARAAQVSDVAVLCAGVQGELALDDAYCAGSHRGRARRRSCRLRRRRDAARGDVRLARGRASTRRRAHGTSTRAGSTQTSHGARRRASSTSCRVSRAWSGTAAEVTVTA